MLSYFLPPLGYFPSVFLSKCCCWTDWLSLLLGVYQSDSYRLEGTVEVHWIFFYIGFYLYWFFLASRDQCGVKSDESNSPSIIFAEFTPEEEKSLGESGVENQNNRLVNYSASVVTRDAGEFEPSLEPQGKGVADESSRSIIGHRLPLQHDSDLEENFTSTEESSEENLNLLGQTEVDEFPRTCAFAVSL